MYKLIITSGPAGSGKTRWAREWAAKDPNQRRVAGSMAEAHELLNRSFDVVLDDERLLGIDVGIMLFSGKVD